MCVCVIPLQGYITSKMLGDKHLKHWIKSTTIQIPFFTARCQPANEAVLTLIKCFLHTFFLQKAAQK